MPLIFDPEMLPPIVADVVSDVVRVTGIDSDIPMTVALTTISAAIGRGLQLESDNGRRTPANIYAIATAASAAGKSSACRPIIEPLHNLEINALESFSHDTLPSLKAEKHVLESDRTRTLKHKDLTTFERIDKVREIEQRLSEIEKEIQPPRIILEDVTTQKLAMLMQRDEQAFVFSSDARDVLLNITGRHNNGDADEGLYLKAFSHEPCAVDRVGRAPVALREPCLSMLLLITPDVVEKLFDSDRLKAGGFLGRCLIVSSKSKPQLIAETQPAPDGDVWRRWDALINDLVATFRRAQAPAIIRAEPGAHKLWRDYHNDIVRGTTEAPNSFTLRHAELAMRLSLILHACQHGSDACRERISVSTAMAGLDLMQQWLSHERINMLNREQTAKDAAMTERVTGILDKHNGQVTVRDLNRKYGMRGKRMDELESFVDRSNDFMWGTTAHDGKGRPGRVLTWTDNHTEDGNLSDLSYCHTGENDKTHADAPF